MEQVKSLLPEENQSTPAALTENSTSSMQTENSDLSIFLRGLNKPVLHNLSYVLRHPELWPEGFVWNFSECKSCAMGLAHQLWFATAKWSDEPKEAPSYMARTFAMPLGEAKEIFMDAGWSRKKFLGYPFGSRAKFSTITPEMVADQIDSYVKRAE